MKTCLRAVLVLFTPLLLSCSGPAPRAESLVPNPLDSKLVGLNCDHFIDESELTHLKAEKDIAVYACMGWVHAKNRAFQMDYLRRAASGRLAEVLGVAALKGDFFLRLMGIREKALEVFNGSLEEDTRLMWAYAYGVNRAFALREVREGYEFKQWGYQPDSWHPVDSMAILLLESLNETQASFWQLIKEEKARERFGNRAKSLLRPYGLPWDTPILKEGETSDTKGHRSATRTPLWDTREGEKPWAPDINIGESGSNSWVIGKSRSQSGHAWLANDPHLEITHPPFWFWIHLEAGGLDVVGATVPGVPVITSGFNRKVAWGLTDSYIATGEILAVPKEDTHSFVTLRPTVFTRIGPFQIPIWWKTFQKSPDGWPVLPIDGPEGKVLVLRWSGLAVTPLGLSPLGRISRSASAKEMAQWFAGVDLPSWNYVFADTLGNFGYRAIGLLPRHDGERPFGVPEGKAATLGDWKFLSPEEGPHIFNPQRDYIVTANNRQEREVGPQDRGRAHKMAFRAFRIEELLKKQAKHNLESMSHVQCDLQTSDARFLVPRLLQFADRLDRRKMGWGVRENQAVDALRDWDFSAAPGCTSCAIYFRWTDRIAEGLGLNLTSLYRLLEEPAEQTFALARALNLALDDLHMVSHRPYTVWGELHRAYFPHLSHASSFEKGDYLKTGGFDHTVNMASADWAGDHYHQRSGSSHRLLVEMTDPPTGYFAMPGTMKDNEQKLIRQDQGPWRQWQECHYRKIRFPMDWSEAKKDQITL